MAEAEDGFKSGFCTIIGCPNVGKSTLLNALLGDKLAITSAKPQTTRNRITGIKTLPDAQLVFIDTPGIHRARDSFNKYMVKVALDAIDNVDALVYMVEPEPKIGDADRYILESISPLSCPVILAINKIDKKPKADLLAVIETYASEMDFREIIPIAALHGDGLDLLLNSLVSVLPPGPMYYPPDMITDLPERFIAAEIVREKIFTLMREEIPFSCAVIVDEFREEPEKELVSITATIYVERDSQKGIIIGKKGEMLKKIGSLARQELQLLLGTKIFLGLWVKVEKNWSRREDLMAKMGYKV